MIWATVSGSLVKLFFVFLILNSGVYLFLMATLYSLLT
jgi:hypothetical protein